ncbi:peroxiredoxin [Paraburkholderia sp. BL8N3]|nr:peroxiredoxin-like family protein [Paraburkholderia sp. BL8N3]TCK33484.1 peroxiredoxin [Paraburkholderia sp. BL8N3]
MKLQQTLDEMKASLKLSMQHGDVNVMHRAIADLIASGQALKAVQAGDHAPPFDLPDTRGRSISSVEMLKKGPLVVSFYRGIWCPFCNLELRALEVALSEYASRGASLVAISPQLTSSTLRSVEDNAFTFPVLRDEGCEVADAFGLRWTWPPDLRATYMRMAVNLAGFNGDETWTSPVPARYIIGQDGVVAYAEINPDYTQRPEPEALFPILDALRSVTVA